MPARLLELATEYNMLRRIASDGDSFAGQFDSVDAEDDLTIAHLFLAMIPNLAYDSHQFAG